MSDVKLTAMTARDVRSEAVEHLMQDMRARLQCLREENDSGDAEVTAKRRGRLNELKDWLALFEQARLADDAFFASPSTALKGIYRRTFMSTERDEDLAFEQGFASVNPEPAEPKTVEVKAEPAPEQEVPAAPAAEHKDAPTEEKIEDPFAAFPPQVRDLLARLPALEAELAQTRRIAGMVPALQSRLDRLAQQQEHAAEQPARRAMPKVDALRGELPEIADALDEVLNTRREEQPAPKPSPILGNSQDAADPHEQALTAVRPSWSDDMVSRDFQLWLGIQPADVRAKVMSTSEAGPVLEALTKFDAYKAQLRQPAPTPTPRPNRMAAAVMPQGDGRRTRPQAEEDEEEAAFNAGFHGKR